MNSIEPNSNPNPTDIYFYRPDLSYLDTAKLFEISAEEGKLRVKNKNVNCLFSHLTADSFDKVYNEYHKYLNLDFDTLIIDDKKYGLTENLKNKLVETMITNWIYYYTIHNLPIQIVRADFTHPDMVDCVMAILDKKYGKDTQASLLLGAKILRQNIDEYSTTVKGRRRYYDR
jgi:hypothetical protein